MVSNSNKWLFVSHTKKKIEKKKNWIFISEKLLIDDSCIDKIFNGLKRGAKYKKNNNSQYNLVQLMFMRLILSARDALSFSLELHYARHKKA